LPDLKQVQPKSREAWRRWLQKHHATSPGVWLVYAKKHTRIPSLTYNDAVEEALCFGWIDSLIHPIDDALYKQVFTPRQPKSRWSAANRTRVARLMAAGLMTAAGAAMVAKKTGLWNAHAAAESLTVPPDLKKALDANDAARQNWPTYTESQRKMFLYRINDAKRLETRAKHIAAVVGYVARKATFAHLYAESKKKKKKKKKTPKRV
jgi:uncharacterized protein YdeI (YjbR/CyaY-like superfamily)